MMKKVKRRICIYLKYFFLNIIRIWWIYHVFRKVYKICSNIEEETFIYLENNYINFKLSIEEWIQEMKKKSENLIQKHQPTIWLEMDKNLNHERSEHIVKKLIYLISVILSCLYYLNFILFCVYVAVYMFDFFNVLHVLL